MKAEYLEEMKKHMLIKIILREMVMDIHFAKRVYVQ